MTVRRDQDQTAQRVKAGMIGLAAVLLLILLAAAVFSTASRDRPVLAVGSARPDVVANLVAGNQAVPAPSATNEPLADLGVAPVTADANTAQPAAATPRR